MFLISQTLIPFTNKNIYIYVFFGIVRYKKLGWFLVDNNVYTTVYYICKRKCIFYWLYFPCSLRTSWLVQIWQNLSSHRDSKRLYSIQKGFHIGLFGLLGMGTGTLDVSGGEPKLDASWGELNKISAITWGLHQTLCKELKPALWPRNPHSNAGRMQRWTHFLGLWRMLYSRVPCVQTLWYPFSWSLLGKWRSWPAKGIWKAINRYVSLIWKYFRMWCSLARHWSWDLFYILRNVFDRNGSRGQAKYSHIQCWPKCTKNIWCQLRGGALTQDHIPELCVYIYICF